MAHNEKPALNMTSGEPTSSWVERHWYWLTIVFGLLLVISIDLFAPVQ
jgi:hypothetical protein